LRRRWIGTIIVIVIVGLIVCGLVYYVMRSSGITSIQDISEHPNEYAGKTVTVEGYIGGISPQTTLGPATGAIYQNNPYGTTGLGYYLMLVFPNNYNTGTLVTFAEYKITGVISIESNEINLTVSQVEPT
jgi:hypothetical protein